MTRNRFASLWIWVFLFPLALDYKSIDKNSGHLAQVLLAVPTLFAGAVLVLIGPSFARKSKLHAFVTFAVMLTVFGSIVPQVMQDNVVGNYLRVLLPFVLFLVAYWVACRPWSDSRIEQIEKAIFWANVVSLAFTLVYGLVTVGGQGLLNVRFRIVSPTFLALQAVLLHEFVIAKRFSSLTLGVFAATLVIELLSVTRSLLLASLLLFLLATWMAAPSARHLAKALLRTAVIGVAIGAVVMAGVSLFPATAKEWGVRISASERTVSGKDPTTITRLAELKEQYDKVTESSTTFLLGEGYGHYYHYSPAYLPDLAGQITKKDFYSIHEWEAGHNFWVYQLFAGGLLFGVALPIALLVALVRCVFAYRKWRATAPGAPDLPVFGRAILLVAAMPCVSIGGNPLGVRFCGVVFGAGLGLMMAMYTQLQRRIDIKRHHHRAVPRIAAPAVVEEPQLITSREAIRPRLPHSVTWRTTGERPAPNGST